LLLGFVSLCFLSWLVVHLSWLRNFRHLFFPLLSLLSFNFALSNFENLLLGLLDQPLFLIAYLLLLSALRGTDFLFLFAFITAFDSFDATLVSDFFLLSLILALLTLLLDLLLAVFLSLIFLFTALSLLPVELLEVFVLLGGVEAFQVGIDLLWDEVLLDADVNNLIIIKDFGVVLAGNLLVMRHYIPLLFF
jgi:hypothetical protein